MRAIKERLAAAPPKRTDPDYGGTCVVCDEPRRFGDGDAWCNICNWCHAWRLATTRAALEGVEVE